jgi:hypothetical protein
MRALSDVRYNHQRDDAPMFALVEGQVRRTRHGRYGEYAPIRLGHRPTFGEQFAHTLLTPICSVFTIIRVIIPPRLLYHLNEMEMGLEGGGT